MIEAKPENLIGDRAYDSDHLDEELKNEGVEMILPPLRRSLNKGWCFRVILAATNPV